MLNKLPPITQSPLPPQCARPAHCGPTPSADHYGEARREDASTPRQPLEAPRALRFGRLGRPAGGGGADDELRRLQQDDHARRAGEEADLNAWNDAYAKAMPHFVAAAAALVRGQNTSVESEQEGHFDEATRLLNCAREPVAQFSQARSHANALASTHLSEAQQKAESLELSISTARASATTQRRISGLQNDLEAVQTSVATSTESLNKSNQEVERINKRLQQATEESQQLTQKLKDLETKRDAADKRRKTEREEDERARTDLEAALRALTQGGAERSGVAATTSSSTNACLRNFGSQAATPSSQAGAAASYLLTKLPLGDARRLVAGRPSTATAATRPQLIGLAQHLRVSLDLYPTLAQVFVEAEVPLRQAGPLSTRGNLPLKGLEYLHTKLTKVTLAMGEVEANDRNEMRFGQRLAEETQRGLSGLVHQLAVNQPSVQEDLNY